MAESSTQQELTFDNYPFLAALGLSKVNHGVYFGEEWQATGPTVLSVNPSTGLPIAEVVEVCNQMKMK
jgi:hypothetical protein